MSDEELVHAELQLDRDLVTLRFRKKAGTLNRDEVGLLKEARKNIARLRTEQIAREKAAGMLKDSMRDLYRSTFKAAADELAKQAVGGSSLGSDLNEMMEDSE